MTAYQASLRTDEGTAQMVCQAGRMYGVEGRDEGLEWRTCMTPHLESTDVGLRCGHVEGYGGTLGEDSDRVIDKLSPWDPQLVI